MENCWWSKWLERFSRGLHRRLLEVGCHCFWAANQRTGSTNTLFDTSHEHSPGIQPFGKAFCETDIIYKPVESMNVGFFLTDKGAVNT